MDLEHRDRAAVVVNSLREITNQSYPGFTTVKRAHNGDTVELSIDHMTWHL